MTNREILSIAMAQTAVDSNCAVEDLCAKENVVVLSKANEGARCYLRLPFFCDLVSYGTNIVASVDERVTDIVRAYLGRFNIEHCFQTPNLYILQAAFEQYAKTPCWMAEYFLPDADVLKPLPCPYEVRLLERGGFSHLYLGQWHNALCANRKERDILALAAYDQDEIVGMAGCSADCESMWQIGIDVLPEYRRQGIAKALTSQLAVEILKRGKVPFYCATWSNIKSVGNAIKSGFYPAWVHLTAIDTDKAYQTLK